MNINSRPLITVYITNFNYGSFIKQAIESVFNQTLQNFELIIIDDGSTDNSIEIINQYQTNPKVKIIKQINKGLNVSNNIALRLAKGEYIIRLDADDWLKENALEELSNVLNKNPKTGLVFADYYHVNQFGVKIERVKRHNFNNVNLLDQPAHGACTLIRTKILRAIGGYDEDFTCQDGFDLWIRFIQEYEVDNINKTLFFYRQHGKNLTRNEKKILSTRAKILDKVSERKNQPLNVISILSVRGKSFDKSCLSFEKLNGKFVLDWTIDEIEKSKKINLLIIDTPDIEIFNYVNNRNKKNTRALLRDPKLAQLNVSLYPSIKSIVQELEAKQSSNYDAIFQFTIDSPFRSRVYIDSAINIMSIFETELVIGVREENDVIYQHNGNGLETVKVNNELRLEREDLYKEVGSMRLIKRKYLFKPEDTPFPKIGHVKLDEKSSLRITSKFSWEVAKHIASLEI